MEKRTFTAIALSVFIILTYQVFLGKFYPNAYKKPSVETKHQQQQIQTMPKTVDSLFLPSQSDASKRFVDTDWCISEFVSDGGGMVFCALKKFVDSLTKKPDTLIDAQDLPPCFSETFLTGNQIINPHYVLSEGHNKDQLIFISESKPFLIYKKISLLRDYLIDINYEITNTSDKKTTFDMYAVAASGINKGNGIDARYIACKVKVNNRIEKHKISKKTKPRFEEIGNIDWLALQDKYFSIAVKTDTKPKGFFIENYSEQNGVCGLIYSIVLNPGESTTVKSIAYLGPNDPKHLRTIGLEELVFSGHFAWAGQSIMNVLRFFHNIFNSWGLALIALGVLVNLILYPITTKRYLESARNMQKLQPKINLLRDKYKDDPKKMNEAMLALYKEHKINPLGGCLPLLLQMPIFIALFRTLMRSIELKGATFLWIKDLAEPDRLFALPFSGMFSHFNLLPILMGLGMFVQQRITQQGAKQIDKQQQQMMFMMPMIFCIMFYNFASGLVLYWLSSTVTMTCFSYLGNKKTS